MYKIKDIELKNFIGLKKILNDENIFKLSLSDDLNKEIIMIFGENGLGKTTLLENLTPYSNMLSREARDSIMYPAHKKITFIEDGSNDEYRFEIYWNTDKDTKGYIFINDKLLENTSKGNISEYNFQIDKLFGDFSKFKNSLFLQQGVLDIVKAKPSERVKIINAFMSELGIYSDIKDNVVKKIDILKSKLESNKEAIEELKSFENRYIDLCNFEENFNHQIFEEEKIKLIEIEKKYLEEHNRLSIKENITSEILKCDNELLQFKNSDLEKQLSDIDIGISELESKLIKLKKTDVLHNEIISLNSSKSKLEQNISLLKLISPENSFKTVSEVLSLKEDFYVKLGDLELDLSKLNTEKENILSFLNLSDLKTKTIEDLVNIKSQLSAFEESKPDKPDFNLEEIVSKLNIIESEGKELRKSSDDFNEANSKLSKILKQLKNIKAAEEKLVIDNDNYNELIKNEERLVEINHILENTNEKHECNSCGQSVDFNILNNKKNELLINISKFNKEELFISKSKLEENNISLIKLERESELLEEKISLINCDFNKELALKKEEYVHFNSIKNSLVAYEEYNLKVSPLREKIKALSENISKLDEKIVKPKFSLQEISKLLSDCTDKINLFKKELDVIDSDFKYFEQCEIKNEKTAADLILYKSNELRSFITKLEILNEEYKQSSSFEKEMSRLKEKKNFLNEQNSKHKSILLKQIDLQEQIREYKDVSEISVKAIKDDYLSLKKIIEEKNVKLIEYKKDLELVNLKLEEYKKIKSDTEDLSNEIYLLSKIKNYSDRIKKASISEFFSNISSFINQIISSEKGTLSGMKLSISQTNNARSFNILVDNNGEVVKDISLLSGAEQGTVARAIYFALAQFSNFGIIWLDECDGMLSDTNKEVFIQMLEKMKDMIGLNQIFLISHNKNLIYKTDLVIDLNDIAEKHLQAT